MKKFTKDLIEVIVIGIIVGTVGMLGVLQYQKAKSSQDINEQRLIKIEQSITDLDNNQVTLGKLIVQLSELNAKTFKAINASIKVLPDKIKLDKFRQEKTLQQVSVMIHNTTLKALGSGVTIKYKGKFYVLSAGHMASVIKDITTFQDNLELWENGGKVCDLEIVKHVFTEQEDVEVADQFKGIDLILLKPTNSSIQPRFYTELADSEPLTATEVYVVGNPMGIEDVVSDGRVILYKDNYMFYIDHTYFGNSGGGVYNQDGKLVGIVSFMKQLQPNPTVPAYMIYGAVRLSQIQKFLEDIE